MSQATDYAVANASGASVRADINSIFAAVASANSGTAEPSTMYSFMIWVDTTNNVVKLRNGANDAWLTMPFSMNASNTVDINGGTVDGATIGASSASTIVGTTIVANTSLNIASDGATVTGIKDEDTMSSNSAVKLATQQSIKAYVDSQVGTVDTLAEILANGNTTGGTDLAVSAADDITFTSSSKAIFNSALSIFHNGGDSIIEDNGTGDLLVRASDQIKFIKVDGSEYYAVFNEDGAVQLYYAGGEKLATVTGGIDVTGTIVCDGGNFDGAATFNDTGADVDFRVESDGNANMLFVDGGNNTVGIGTASPNANVSMTISSDGSGSVLPGVKLIDSNSGDDYQIYTNAGNFYVRNATDGRSDIAIDGDGAATFGGAMTITTADNTDTLTLISTDADASVGPVLNLYRNSASPADNDAVGHLKFIARNDNSQDWIASQMVVTAIDVSDGSEDAVLDWYILTDGANSNRLSFAAAETVFNDGSVDLDFRVESNGNANMLFVDGGNDTVGIGTSSNFGKLSVNVSSGAPATSGNMTNGLTVHNTDGGRAIQLGVNDSGGYTFINSGYVNSAGNSQPLAIFTGGTERLRIDASGNVEINETLTIGATTNRYPFEVALANTEIAMIGGASTNAGGEYCGIGLGQVNPGDTTYQKLSLVAEGIGSGYYIQNFHILVDTNEDSNAAVLADKKFSISGNSGLCNANVGLTFGSDTAAANALDDYEEGTWTPVMTRNSAPDIAYTVQQADYTKIGNMVTISMTLLLTAVTAQGSSVTYINGLPFSNGGIAYSWVGSVGMNNGFASECHICQISGAGGTAMTFHGADIGFANLSTDFTNGGYIQCSLTYQTDS